MLFYRMINPCFFILFIMIRNIAVQSNEYPHPQIINYPSVLQAYTLFFLLSTCSKTYGKHIFYFYYKTKIALSSPHPISDGIFEGKRDSTVIFFLMYFFFLINHLYFQDHPRIKSASITLFSLAAS